MAKTKTITKVTTRDRVQMTISVFCAKTGKSPSTVGLMCRDKRIPAVKPGSEWYILAPKDKDAFNKFVASIDWKSRGRPAVKD